MAAVGVLKKSLGIIKTRLTAVFRNYIFVRYAYHINFIIYLSGMLTI